MKVILATTLLQERGILTAHATLQDPEVRLEGKEEAILRIEEGGVRLALEFFDTDGIRRFQEQIGRLVVSEKGTC